MNIAVLDYVTVGADLDLAHLSALAEARGGECRVYETSTDEEAKERIRDVHVIVINKIHITEELLTCANTLRLICITATGYDKIDIAACRRRGIAVCNVTGYSTESVAQLTVAMALSLFNCLPDYNEAVRSGRYTASGIANLLTPVFHEVAGKTWGIVGLGNIGKRVAKIAEALGCRVIAYSRTQAEDYTNVDLETICRESDLISLHTPLNEGTRGLIGEKEIALMKNGVVLINVARGAVTDEKAVAEAVKSGHIAALGVDVYSEEPMPENHPYYEIRHLLNVSLTPHIAWSAKEARERCLREVELNIDSFLSGGTRNRVDL